MSINHKEACALEHYCDEKLKEIARVDGNAYTTHPKTIKESKVFDCLVFDGGEFAIIKEAELNQKKSDFIAKMNQYLEKAEIPQVSEDEIERMCFEKDKEDDCRPILYKCHKTGIVAILGEDCLYITEKQKDKQ